MTDDDREGRRYGGPRPGENPAGETYGEAGGYNTAPGQSAGDFDGEQAGEAPAGGRGSERGGYTGQTGSGYGRTPGGGSGAGQGWRDSGAAGAAAGLAANLWDRARQTVSGVFGEERDSLGRGPHRGRGPKTYSRSDGRIQDDVNDRLTDDPFLDATHIDVSVEKGEVTLAGTVGARADKRRAEDLADEVSGVRHVQNNLRIQDASASASPPASAGDPSI